LSIASFVPLCATYVDVVAYLVDFLVFTFCSTSFPTTSFSFAYALAIVNVVVVFAATLVLYLALASSIFPFFFAISSFFFWVFSFFPHFFSVVSASSTDPD